MNLQFIKQGVKNITHEFNFKWEMVNENLGVTLSRNKWVKGAFRIKIKGGRRGISLTCFFIINFLTNLMCNKG